MKKKIRKSKKRKEEQEKDKQRSPPFPLFILFPILYAVVENRQLAMQCRVPSAIYRWPWVCKNHPTKKIWIKGPFTNYAKHYAGVWCTLERAKASSTDVRIVQINVACLVVIAFACTLNSVYSKVKAESNSLYQLPWSADAVVALPLYTVPELRTLRWSLTLTVQDFVQFYFVSKSTRLAWDIRSLIRVISRGVARIRFYIYNCSAM